MLQLRSFLFRGRLNWIRWGPSAAIFRKIQFIWQMARCSVSWQPVPGIKCSNRTTEQRIRKNQPLSIWHIWLEKPMFYFHYYYYYCWRKSKKKKMNQIWLTKLVYHIDRRVAEIVADDFRISNYDSALVFISHTDEFEKWKSSCYCQTFTLKMACWTLCTFLPISFSFFCKWMRGCGRKMSYRFLFFLLPRIESVEMLNVVSHYYLFVWYFLLHWHRFVHRKSKYNTKCVYNILIKCFVYFLFSYISFSIRSFLIHSEF